MPEIREPREGKTNELSHMVEQNVNRLHDLERRLFRVQGDLANLNNLATLLQPHLAGGSPVTAFGADPSGFGTPPFSFSPGGPPSAFFASPSASSLPAFAAGYPGMGASPPTPLPTRSILSGAGTFSEARTAVELERMTPVPRIPVANVVDAGDHYVLQVELPGVKKEDVDIRLSERSVTVSASARLEVEEGTVLMAECVPVAYRRTIPLPSATNSNQSKATIKDGFLTLLLPKREPTEGPRRLDVAYG